MLCDPLGGDAAWPPITQHLLQCWASHFEKVDAAWPPAHVTQHLLQSWTENIFCIGELTARLNARGILVEKLSGDVAVSEYKVHTFLDACKITKLFKQHSSESAEFERLSCWSCTYQKKNSHHGKAVLLWKIRRDSAKQRTDGPLVFDCWLFCRCFQSCTRDIVKVQISHFQSVAVFMSAVGRDTENIFHQFSWLILSDFLWFAWSVNDNTSSPEYLYISFQRWTALTCNQRNQPFCAACFPLLAPEKRSNIAVTRPVDLTVHPLPTCCPNCVFVPVHSVHDLWTHFFVCVRRRCSTWIVSFVNSNGDCLWWR